MDIASLGDPLGELDGKDQEVVLGHFRNTFVRVRNNPLRYGFPPHAGQEEVHCSTHDHILLISGNRWGKSTAGIREAMWRATHTHPYKEIPRHRVIWCGFPDYPFYVRVTERLFNTWAPRGYLLDFHQTKKRATFRQEGGGICDVYFLSYDSGRDKWQGGAVDFIWLDEEHPEDISKEAMGRLIDTRGTMLRTLTPVSGMGWIYKRLYQPAIEGKRRIHVVHGALAEHDESRELGIGRSLVPHMDYDQVLRFAREIPDEDERWVRIFGKFRKKIGLVYKQWNEKIHVVPAFDIPSHWTIWGGVDPGYHGFCCVLMAQDDMGRAFVVGEVFSQQEPTAIRLKRISEELWKIRPKKAFTDPVIVMMDTEDPQTVLEMNILAGRMQLPIAFASLDQGLKARKAGFTRIQHMLSPRSDRPRPSRVKRERDGEAEAEAKGEPLLYFLSNLDSTWRDGDDQMKGSRVVWEIGQYSWKRKGPDKSATDDADEESAGGAHAMAALRYSIMARFGSLEEPGEEEPEVPLDPMAREAWDHLRELEEIAQGRAGDSYPWKEW